jgi:hypothetical protein
VAGKLDAVPEIATGGQALRRIRVCDARVTALPAD